MAVSTAKYIAAIAQQALDEKWGYVYGGQGELYSEQTAQTFINKGYPVPDKTSKKQYFMVRCKRWFGYTVVDCSGLIVWAIQQTTPKYGDKTANTFNAQFSKSGTMATIPNIPGIAVWFRNHIGIYMGNGYVIESRGTDYGVVKTKLKDRPWTRWGMIRDVDYEATENINPATPQGDYKQMTVKTNGGTLNVRAKPNTSATILAKLANGTKVNAKADVNGWSHVQVNSKGRTINGYVSDQWLK